MSKKRHYLYHNKQNLTKNQQQYENTVTQTLHFPKKPVSDTFGYKYVYDLLNIQKNLEKTSILVSNT